MTSRRTAMRVVDVAVAGVALVALAPLLVVIALAVRLGSRGPVLFRQDRVGLGGRPFTLLKFRTMRVRADGPRITPIDDRRVTRVGAWLRRSKLDELPQLVNVLRGDMTLIGPRPEVPEYLARIGETGRAYAAVRPGLADAATLAFYDEGDRLARVAEPERYYLETILPEKARVSVDYAARRTWRSDLRLLVALGRRIVVGAIVVALCATPAHAGGSLVVVAPHPDDEVLAAGGMIANALATGSDVRVIVVTNGDYHGVDQGLVRQRESVDGLAVLGVPESRVVFLGYPDGALLSVWNEAPLAGQSFLAPTTGRSTTYGARGFGAADFHTVVTGAPAPYDRAALVDDLRQALDRFRPTQIVVTGAYDEHPDHRATYYAVRDAIRLLTGADPSFAPVVQTTIVHDPVTYPFDDFWRPGTSDVGALALVGDDRWPNPAAGSGVPFRFDPTVPFAMPPSLPRTILDWSLRARWPVPAAMEIDDFGRNLKIASLSRYLSQASDVLWAHAKADEFTWPEVVRVGSYRFDVAGVAEATASSALPGQPPTGVNDGIVDGAPVHPQAEWVAAEPGAAWVRLHWRAPLRIDRVRVFDRVDATNHVTAGRLVLDDTSTILVGTLANDGRGDDIVLPAPRVVSSVKFQIDAVVGTAGLAELEVYGDPPAGACTSDEECDDANRCTIDACRAGRCVHEPVADDTPCGDGDDCNGVEVCRAGACVRNPPPVCDDGDPCTLDRCVPPGRCAHVPTCAPVPAHGPARCRVGFVGLPAGPCEDGDPLCDRDRTTDGRCRFDVVVCVNPRAVASGCPPGKPITAVAVGGPDATLARALRTSLTGHLPTQDRTCVGPIPVPVELRGPRRTGTARMTVPIRVTTAGGRRMTARARFVCRAAAPGVVHRPPATLRP